MFDLFAKKRKKHLTAVFQSPKKNPLFLIQKVPPSTRLTDCIESDFPDYVTVVWMMRQIAFQAFFLIFQCFSSEVFTLFLRVETGHQNIAINGRDPYYGHFTKIYFHNLTCIYSIDIHCLKELTGAEEIDLLYSECRRGHWQVAHYTNSKHNFRLKEAIHAQRLLISSRSDLAIIDAQVDSCSSNISKPSIDCNRSSREHIHRHGKQGSILRAVDSTIIEHQRYKRDTSKPTTFHEISSGLHEINKDLIVERGSILTIKAGSHLKFNKNSGIIVLGILHINGTSLSPVIMESKNPEQYQWKGIIFNDAELNNIISNLNISGAEAGIKVERGPTPYLENVNLNRNGYGINIRHPSTFTYLTGIVSSNNEKNGIEYLGQV